MGGGSNIDLAKCEILWVHHGDSPKLTRTKKRQNVPKVIGHGRCQKTHKSKLVNIDLLTSFLHSTTNIRPISPGGSMRSSTGKNKNYITSKS